MFSTYWWVPVHHPTPYNLKTSAPTVTRSHPSERQPTPHHHHHRLLPSHLKSFMTDWDRRYTSTYNYNKIRNDTTLYRDSWVWRGCFEENAKTSRSHVRGAQLFNTEILARAFPQLGPLGQDRDTKGGVAHPWGKTTSTKSYVGTILISYLGFRCSCRHRALILGGKCHPLENTCYGWDLGFNKIVIEL